MSSRFVLIAVLYACLGLCAQMHAQSPSPSEVKNLSPDKKWEYACPQSIEYECAPEVVKAGTNETVVDLDGDLNVYGKYSKRSNIAWAPDSKRFAFNFSQPAAHAFYETLAFYELHGDKWEMLESLAKANPISKAISKAISGGLAVERTKKHIKAKATGAIEIVAKVHEWTDPDTVIVYAYEEDGEETGKTVRVDFLFTLKFDEAGKFKIVKTQQLSEEESQKYQQDSQN
jgi:hypothetical protein